MNILRVPVLGLILLASLVGCASRYEGDIVVHAKEPGVHGGIYQPPDAATTVGILQSDEVWSKYIAPHLPAGDVAVIRDGYSIEVLRLDATGVESCCELKIRLKSGGERAFDTVASGIKQYLEEEFDRSHQQALRLMRERSKDIIDTKIREKELERITEAERASRLSWYSVTINKPNKALVPTVMSVTPAADAPVAPATTAAHL